MTTARIEIDQDIQPFSEFRKHAADFIDRIKKQKRSIVLTQHGKSAAVWLMCQSINAWLIKLT